MYYSNSPKRFSSSRFMTLMAMVCLFSSVQMGMAQKGAPVVGDAATLIDLLYKDYTSIAQESRVDEIMRDRSQAISILKSYMTDEQRNSIQPKISPAFKGSLESRNSLLQILPTQKEKYLSLSKVEIRYGNGSTFVKNDTLLSSEIAAAKSRIGNSEYHLTKVQFSMDTMEMRALQLAYEKYHNPFLAYVTGKMVNKYKLLHDSGQDPYAKSNYLSSVQKGIPFIGGNLSFDMLIKGFSKFLAKRLKEELTVYILDRVKGWLDQPAATDPFAEFKVLLPRTVAYLKSFSVDQITNFPNEIKQYLEDDLNHILPNSANLRTTPRIKKLIDRSPEVAFAFEAYELIPQLAKLKRPIDYFDLLENSSMIQKWSTLPDSQENQLKFNIANTLKMASLMAHSLTVIETGQTKLANTNFLSNYAGDFYFQLLYLGFLHQQNAKYFNVAFLKNKTQGTELVEFKLEAGINSLFSEITPTNIEAVKTKLGAIESFLSTANQSANEVFEQAANIRKANKARQKVGADTVQAFVGSLIDLSEEIVLSSESLIQTLLPDDTTKVLSFASKAKPYFLAARNTNEIILDLRKERYAIAIIKAIELPGQLVLPSSGASPELLNQLTQLVKDVAHIGNSDEVKQWQKVAEFIHSDDSRISDRLQKAILFVQARLEEMQVNSQAQMDVKIQIALYLEKLKNGPQSLASIKYALKTNLGTPEFKRLLLSHFLNEIALLDASKIIQLADSLVLTIPQKNGQPLEIDLFDDTQAKKLGNLFATLTTQFVDQFITKGNTNNLENIKTELSDFLNSYTASIPSKVAPALPPKVRKLVHFLNNIAIANTTEDMENAIESFALPSGSFTLKRNTRFNVALQSYPGILIGASTVWGKDSTGESTTETKFTPSFAAPVGISFAWGTKKGWSHGVFASVLDVGALTRFYFDSDDSTSTLPEVSFKNVLAPGIYYTWGLKNLPVSFNFGIQYGPDLKVITPDETTFKESLRWGAGVTVDIPLLNLYSRPRIAE